MTSLLPILMFAVAATVTPGPNNVVVFNSALHQGIRRTLPVYAGICLGFPVLFIIVGLGLGKAFVLYPALHWFLRVVGAGYLLLLAWKIAVQPARVESSSGFIPSSFTGGILFQWINPKAWVIAVGGISAYTSTGTSLVDAFSFALVFLVATIPCVGVWLLLGRSARVAMKTPQRISTVNKFMGALLAASVLPVIWDVIR